jgi:hypothetical protein
MMAEWVTAQYLHAAATDVDQDGSTMDAAAINQTHLARLP